MVKGFGSLASALVVAVLLAGCGESSEPKVQEIVVESTPEVVESADPVAPPATPRGERGHLAGFVLDATYRPLEGATIDLPGIDLTDQSDRDGSFAFADLIPGPYLVRANFTGHLPIESIIDIDAGDFTRVKFILKPIPAPEPYNETFKFDGFTTNTASSIAPNFFSGSLGAYNAFVFDVGPDLEALVIEAIMEPYAGLDAGVGVNNGFRFVLDDAETGRARDAGVQGNPLLAIVDGEAISNETTRYRLEVRPESFPLPEQNKEFEVFVTAFYREGPPANWSFIEQESG